MFFVIYLSMIDRPFISSVGYQLSHTPSGRGLRKEIINENTKQNFVFPTWFLKALGNGGLAVSFFMYLMFMIDHKGPMPVFADVYREISQGGITAILVIIDMAIILFFALRYFLQLYIQIKNFTAFKKTEGYEALLGTNLELGLMTIPLTLAMGVNISLILGAVFVPNLWHYVEYLFPLAIIGFLTTGIYGLKLFLNYFKDTVSKGNFDFVINNHLGQMIAPFTFIMVSVGLAAPAAMSKILLTNMIGLIGSIFFLVLTLILLSIKLFLGFKSIFEYGIELTNLPTLWIMIPIMTLMGITFVRLTSSVSHHLLHTNPSPILLMIVLTFIVAIQGVFALLGYALLKDHGYFNRYVNGSHFDVGSYSLICPGVATNVIGMFFIHYAFVKTELVLQNSIYYYMMLLPIVWIQIKTITTLFKLDKKGAVAK